MASKGAIAALHDESVKRLQENIDKLSKALGVEPLKLTEYDRDPELLMAYRLQDMANWTDALVKQSEPTKKEQAVKPVEDADRDTEDPDAAPRANTVTPKSSKGKS